MMMKMIIVKLKVMKARLMRIFLSNTCPSIPNHSEVQKRKISFEFIRKLETAFYVNRVHSDNKVDILKKLVRGNAEYSVSDYKSLDENIEWLKKVFGNPHAIGRKKKKSFYESHEKKSGTGQIISRHKGN